MNSKKVAIFGVGNRGNFYGELAGIKPGKMQVVQIVDTNETALEVARKIYKLDKKDCYNNVEAFLKDTKIADAVINCTMDKYHIQTTMPLFKLGYDVLLEKPICMNPDELLDLMNESKKYNKTLMICHVLRYTPFYRTIKKKINEGVIGNLITIEMSEHVYVPHMLVSFVRGQWKSESECGTPMIMQKCCHDTDLMCWLNSTSRPTEVSSFGNRSVFTPKNKPEGAADKCMNCKFKKSCIYSCFYNLDLDGFDSIMFNNAFPGKKFDELTREDKIKVLTESDSLGKCAFDGPQDLVDHQTTAVNFENGVSASLTMVGGCSYPCRKIHIVGTKGEIFGMFESKKITVQEYIPEKFNRTTKHIYLGNVGKGHGGGDLRLIEDFIDYLRTGKSSISQTSIEDSIDGHLLGIGADMSDKCHRIIRISADRKLIKE